MAPSITSPNRVVAFRTQQIYFTNSFNVSRYKEFMGEKNRFFPHKKCLVLYRACYECRKSGMSHFIDMCFELTIVKLLSSKMFYCTLIKVIVKATDSSLKFLNNLLGEVSSYLVK